jgi:hypothetical protein
LSLPRNRSLPRIRPRTDQKENAPLCIATAHRRLATGTKVESQPASPFHFYIYRLFIKYFLEIKEQTAEQFTYENFLPYLRSDGHLAPMEERRNTYNILGREPEEKRLSGRGSGTWDFII